MPQRVLPDVRQAITAETATVEAIVPGSQDVFSNGFQARPVVGGFFALLTV